MIRGTGHIADPRSWYTPASAVVGAVAPAPAVSDGCAAFAPSPVDQGGDQSCVSEASSQAIFTRLGVEGLPQVMPSARAIWYWTRHKEGTESENVGCRPANAWRAMASCGYPSAADWPRSRRLDERPDELAMRRAFDQRSILAGRISSYGNDRLNEVRAAVHVQFPVCLAQEVDEAYMLNTNGIWVPGGEKNGWHYTFATHYDREGLWTLGSYGTSWGKNGFIRVPWVIVADELSCVDLWAIRFAEAPQ